MKDFKFVLTIVLFSFTLIGFSQKIKLKKGDILVDDTVWMKYNDCGGFDNSCSILNLQGEELIFVKWHHLDGELPITPSNKNGTLHYSEVKFLGLNATVEFQGRTSKKIIEFVHEANLINAEGKLDEDNVTRFVEKHGNPVSAKLNRDSNKTNTVIIREEPRKSGVNINIGR